MLNFILNLFKSSRTPKFNIGDYIIIPYCQGTICYVEAVTDDWITYKYIASKHPSGNYMKDNTASFNINSENGKLTRPATENDFIEILGLTPITLQNKKLLNLPS